MALAVNLPIAYEKTGRQSYSARLEKNPVDITLSTAEQGVAVWQELHTSI